MKIKDIIKAIGIAFLGAILVNCSAEDTQEVNDENCTLKNINNIQDQEKRKNFLSECQKYKSEKGGFVPSTNRTW